MFLYVAYIIREVDLNFDVDNIFQTKTNFLSEKLALLGVFFKASDFLNEFV